MNPLKPISHLDLFSLGLPYLMRAVSPPSSGRDVFLTGNAWKSFCDFFKNGRPYLYAAEIDFGNGRKTEVQFELNLVDFLQECTNELKEAKIEVEDILLKGGALQQILDGRSSKLSDLDFTICIKDTQDPTQFDKAEAAFLRALHKFAKLKISYSDYNRKHSVLIGAKRVYTLNDQVIFEETVKDLYEPDHPVFSANGSRTARFRLFNEENRFSLHSLPTRHLGFRQELDFQFAAQIQTPCFTSCDSLVISLKPLVDLKRNERIEQLKIPLKSVGGYDVQEALDLRQKRLFDVVPRSIISEIKGGLRGYCRLLSRGYYPISLEIEDGFFQQALKEHQSVSEFEGYLEKHYSEDLQGKIVYLLNYYSIVQRAIQKGTQCSQFEQMILGKLCQALGENKKLYTDKELQQFAPLALSYLYLRSNGLDKEGMALFLVDRGRGEAVSNHHLFFLNPSSLLEDLKSQLDETIFSNKLVQRLVEQFPPLYPCVDLPTFFKEKLKPAPVPVPITIQEPVVEEKLIETAAPIENPAPPVEQVIETLEPIQTPISFAEQFLLGQADLLAQNKPKVVKHNLFLLDLKKLSSFTEKQKLELQESIQKTIFKLLQDKNVKLVEEIIVWAAEKKLLDPLSHFSFFDEVFKELNIQGCSSRTLNLLGVLNKAKYPILPFVSSIAKHIKGADEMRKLIEMVITNDSKDLTYDAFSDLYLAVFSHYPECVEKLKTLTQSTSLTFHRQLLENSQKTAMKVAVEIFKHLYPISGHFLFLQEDDALNIELLKSFLSHMDPSFALDLYEKLEGFLIKNESYLFVYQKFIVAIRSIKPWNAIAESLVLRGLTCVENRENLDEEALNVLKTFQNYPDLYLNRPPILNALKEILQKLDSSDLKGLKKAIETATTQKKKPQPAPKKRDLEELVKQLKSSSCSMQDVFEFLSLDSGIIFSLNDRELWDVIESLKTFISKLNKSDTELLDKLYSRIHEKFLALTKVEPPRHIVPGAHMDLLQQIILKKLEMNPTQDSLKEYKLFMDVMKEGFEKGALDLVGEQKHSVARNWLLVKMFMLCESREGINLLFKGLNSLADRKKCSGLTIARLYLMAFGAAISYFSKVKGLPALQITLNYFHSMISSLDKIPKGFEEEWKDALQYGADFVYQLAENLSRPPYDSDAAEQIKLVSSAFQKLTDHSPVMSSEDLTFDLDPLFHARNILIGLPYTELSRFCTQQIDRFRDLFSPDEDFAETASYQELHQLAKNAIKSSVAVRYFTLALEKEPDEPSILLDEAVFYKNLKDLDSAIRSYEKALDSKHENATATTRYRAAVGLGNIYSEKKNWYQAIMFYHKAMECIDEPESLVYHNVSVCYSYLKMSDQALKYAEKAFKELHTQIEVYSHWAKMMVSWGSEYGSEQAFGWVKQKVVDGEETVEIFTLLADLHKLRKSRLEKEGPVSSEVLEMHWQEILGAYQGAHILQPNNPGFLSHCGEACFKLNDLDNAVAFLSKALEIDPHYTNCLYYRAECYARKKQFDLAIKDISLFIDMQLSLVDTGKGLDEGLTICFLSRVIYCLGDSTPSKVKQAKEDFEFVSENSSLNLIELSKLVVYQSAKAHLDGTLAQNNPSHKKRSKK